MNILQLRKSINLFLFTFLFISMTSCKAQENTLIVEIFRGIEIDSINYEYSKSSIFKLTDVYYSLRQKAVYNENGDIDKLILYKPEGVIEYNREKLLGDKNIADYYGFPLKQKWSYKDGYLITGINRIKVLKVKNELLKTDINGLTTFYKLK